MGGGGGTKLTWRVFPLQSYGPYFNQTASTFCEPCTDKWNMANQYNAYTPL